MTHIAKDCDSCRSASPCAEYEASKREPRGVIWIHGRELRLTRKELGDAAECVAAAIAEMESDPVAESFRTAPRISKPVTNARTARRVLAEREIAAGLFVDPEVLSVEIDRDE